MARHGGVECPCGLQGFIEDQASTAFDLQSLFLKFKRIQDERSAAFPPCRQIFVRQSGGDRLGNDGFRVQTVERPKFG